MRSAQLETLEALLSAAPGLGRRAGPAAAHRRVVHGAPILWLTQDCIPASDQPQGRPTPDARDGSGWPVSRAEPKPARSRTPRLPLSFAEFADDSPQSGLGDRYHLYPPTGRLAVPGGRVGLAQPLRGQLGTGRRARVAVRAALCPTRSDPGYAGDLEQR